ncbi:MAG: metallophosphoesterase [Pseudomonadota bacterium]
MFGPPRLVRHAVKTPLWRGAPLTLAVLSDLHVVAPWASLAALRRVVAQVNALGPDLVAIPGDFLADPKIPGRRPPIDKIVAVLEGLTAPLGVHTTLGNHDWADDPEARATRGASNGVARALGASALHFYSNRAQRIPRAGGDIYVVGVESSVGEGSTRRPRRRDNLSSAMAELPASADVILLAHEPDLWVEQRPFAALTVSGHTHAGQIVLAGRRPLTPSRYGARFAHGHFEEDDRHLVVSAGLGYTGVPIRIGAPREITLVRLSPAIDPSG